MQRNKFIPDILCNYRSTGFNPKRRLPSIRLSFINLILRLMVQTAFHLSTYNGSSSFLKLPLLIFKSLSVASLDNTGSSSYLKFTVYVIVVPSSAITIIITGVSPSSYRAISSDVAPLANSAPFTVIPEPLSLAVGMIVTILT